MSSAGRARKLSSPIEVLEAAYGDDEKHSKVINKSWSRASREKANKEK